MTLTEEDLKEIEDCIPRFGVHEKDAYELLRGYRAYRDTEQSGRLLPVIPRGYQLEMWTTADSDYVSAYIYKGTSKSGDDYIAEHHAETPAVAVTAALRGLDAD